MFRAAADAEKIHDYVLAFEQKQVQNKTSSRARPGRSRGPRPSPWTLPKSWDNPDVSFSHYQAFRGDTLEDALRSRGLENRGQHHRHRSRAVLRGRA